MSISTQDEKILHLKKFYPALPDNLSVGDYLDLLGTQITGSVYECGDSKRTIHVYNHPDKGRVVALGCFIGGLAECEAAINREYSGKEADDYIAKVRQAFALNL